MAKINKGLVKLIRKCCLNYEDVRPEEVLAIILTFSGGQLWATEDNNSMREIERAASIAKIPFALLKNVMQLEPGDPYPNYRFQDGQWQWAQSLSFMSGWQQVLLSSRYGLGMISGFSIVMESGSVQNVVSWIPILRQFWRDPDHQIQVIIKNLIGAKLDNKTQKEFFHEYVARHYGISGQLTPFSEELEMVSLMPVCIDLVKRSRIEEMKDGGFTRNVLAPEAEMAEDSAGVDSGSEDEDDAD